MNGRQAYSKATVKLLKGTVYDTDTEWDDVVLYQKEIFEYLSVIGLELIVRREEGYAFLKQSENEDQKTLGLVTRTKIGFEVSILLVVLRHILEEHDSDPTTKTFDKTITNKDIEEEMKLFLPKTSNEVKLLKDLNRYVSKAEEYGFLKTLKPSGSDSVYKIERIIKDKISIDDMIKFKKQLEDNADTI